MHFDRIGFKNIYILISLYKDKKLQESPNSEKLYFPGQQDKVSVDSCLFLNLDAIGRGRYFNASTIYLTIALVPYLSKSENFDKIYTKSFLLL